MLVLLCAVPLVWSDHVVSRAFSKTLGLIFPHSLFRNLSAYIDDITNHIPLNIAKAKSLDFSNQNSPFLSFLKKTNKKKKSQKKKQTAIWNQNHFQRETSSLSLCTFHYSSVFTAGLTGHIWKDVKNPASEYVSMSDVGDKEILLAGSSPTADFSCCWAVTHDPPLWSSQSRTGAGAHCE